ncbi:hypothetical protein ABZY58_11225 [Micromonospora tulbaghiae]|uniref:hypothetical protein n=1 Tax=Micromonospora tulbaghiae TaxID=479978 RepID=UPI0033ADABFA
MTTKHAFVTDADGWGHRAGARFVGPREWLHGLPQEWTRDSLHMDSYTEALAAAADDEGVILDFRVDEWYEGALSDSMREEYDEPGWTLKYDRFVAMLLTDIDMMLHEAGYQASRGNGDTTDRRLTLPA